MKRNTCAACGYDDLEMFLDLGLSPIADAYTSDPHETSSRYPLQVGVCTGCWLVQLLEVVDHQTLFGTGYSFYSSASPPLSEYHASYAASVLKNFKHLAKSLTVEIGCNDGDLLHHFAEARCRALGVDPASGPVGVARSRGLSVLEQPFSPKAAQEIKEEYGSAGVIIANHVLAHVESVSDVLEGVAHLLSDDGVAFIEVQYLPDLLVNNAFDLVYHEHRNFFSLTSLRSALARWGLYIDRVELTDRQGGSLRVAATKRPHGQFEVQAMWGAKEAWLCQLGVYEGFQGRIERIRDRLCDLVSQASPLIGYGAPAKATTLINYCRFDRDNISYVIDSTAAKQGRYIPGTAIKIVAPDPVYLERNDNVLLLAWNYAPQIIRANSAYRGRWIVPIPAPVVL
jgi:hypothetical protein